MIEYLEIRDKNRTVIGIIDTAQSIIWHSVYNGVGDFEIYAQATPKHLELLVEGNYVTRIDNLEIGIIEDITISYNAQDGRMITATGRFAKSILDRRLIYRLGGSTNYATIIRGRVENACRVLVNDNAINCTWDASRNITDSDGNLIIELGKNENLPEIIVDENGAPAEKQVSYENLLTYTDAVLEEYNLSATVILNSDTKKLQYVVFKGVDRSTDNTEGNEPIIFSQEFDNLSESEYSLQTSTEKNVALIGGEGEGLERFYSIITNDKAGLDRRETFVDASSINKQYKDEQDVEHTYTDEEYKKLLNAQGKQTLSTMKRVEAFSGALDITIGQYKLNRDFSLGDIVTVQDNEMGIYINARIVETTEAQDENGYTVEAVYK